MIRVVLNRDVLKIDYHWLKRDFINGEKLYLYEGETYGCISKNGIACSVDGQVPFFEIPKSNLTVIIEDENNMTFQYRAKLSMAQLAIQPPVTLEEARAQILWLKNNSTTKIKKMNGHMNTENENQQNVSINTKGNFLRSMIKINHPDWTPEQIEAEFKRQMTANDNNEDNICESCSG